MMLKTPTCSNTEVNSLPIHADCNAVPSELEAAAGLLISLRRGSSLGQAKSHASAKRQREVLSSEVRPTSRQRLTIDLTVDDESSCSRQHEPARAAPPFAVSPSISVLEHTAVDKTPRYVPTFSPASSIGLARHVQARGVDARNTEGKFKGWSALHIAAYTGDLDVLRLAHGKTRANLNACVSHDANILVGATPVETAIWGKQANAIRYLASIGADVRSLRTQGVHSGLSPLHLAVLVGDLRSVQVLLETWVTNPHEPSVHPEWTGLTAVSIAGVLHREDILRAFFRYDQLLNENPLFREGASLLAKHSMKLS